jgi:biopolymer transport protein TolR
MKVQPIEAGNGGGGGRARRPRVASTLNEINVVPLVDVMLVLLIIFMVTAPMMQRGLDVNLPQARRAQEINDQRLFVSVPLSYRKDHKVSIGEEKVSFDMLSERIRQAMKWRTDKQVFLQSDAGLSVQDLMDVMDKLKEGGVETVGVVAKWPEGAR